MRKITLFLIDIFLLYTSLVTMLAVRYDETFSEQLQIHLIPFGVIFALWLIIFYIANLYDQHTFRNSANFYTNLFRAIVIAGVISTSFFYLIPIFGITPKTNLFIFIVIFSVLDTAARTLFNYAAGKIFKRSVLIVGDTPSTHETADFIIKNPQLGYELVEIINPDNIQHLKEAIDGQHINIIVISPEGYQIPELINVFYHALDKRIIFYDLLTFYERITGKVPLGAISQTWFLENLSEGQKHGYEFFKRIGDVVFGLVFGIISLIFYPFIIIAMQIDSPGPIFYRQTRIGRMGKTFQLIKFRNMIPNAEAKTGAVWASENDPRITRVGNFLRKTRLDEIPQFWIIVKGEMSLVGPRAERPEFHKTLKREVPFYEERYLIKPGLSGWAQINYPYGASVNDAAEKLKYDLYYIKNRSIALDIGIILKTIRISLSQAGK
jgi:exopolysaccharide biosynthesis polyprenyl glycosylphosphotransferase